MAISLSGGGSRNTRKEPPTLGKQLANFITRGCESSAPFLQFTKLDANPRRIGFMGSYWFADENQRAQTVNTERYVAVLMKFWASLVRRRGIDRDEQCFQQDGATHTHQMTP